MTDEASREPAGPGDVAWRAALALGGAVLIVVLGGGSPGSAAGALVMLVCVVLIGTRRGQPGRISAAADASADAEAGIQNLLHGIMPVWSRQLETCRGEGDAAVARLARDFSGMVTLVEGMLAELRSAKLEMGSEGIVPIIERSESELKKVVMVLKALKASRDGLFGKLESYASDLSEMGADVQQIALQIQLLSMNGTIEAVRTNGGGKSFAVVVSEMRKLSVKSSEVGAKISKKVQTVNAALAEMFTQEHAGGALEATSSIDKAEREIETILAEFKGLGDRLKTTVGSTERGSSDLKGRIESALVALQFQDRVSQIVSHVCNNMAELDSTLSGHVDGDLSVNAWIDRMSNLYTATEEFENLHGRSRGVRPAATVTFF